jgi:hypothetical protein
MGARRGVGGVLVGKLKERNRVEDLSMRHDNIKMDLCEIGWGGVDLIHLGSGLVKETVRMGTLKHGGSYLATLSVV